MGLALACQAPAMAAEVSCTPQTGFTYCKRFTYSGNAQVFSVPAGVRLVKATAWGAGGGGSFEAGTNSAGGGAGGFAEGIVSVQPGTQLTITVGQGGMAGGTARTYGGGGAGAPGSKWQQADRLISNGSSGGGMSAVWAGAQFQASTARLIAGGGGGGAYYTDQPASKPVAGGGGGNAATPANASTYGGGGGTATAGGLPPVVAGGVCYQPTTAPANTSYGATFPVVSQGRQFIGGDGCWPNIAATTDQYEGGGGGGGGWYGGGGGFGQSGNSPVSPSMGYDGPGGGGSGYINTAYVSTPSSGVGASGSYTAGSMAAPGQPNHALRSTGVGQGGLPAILASDTVDKRQAGHGEVVIQWNDPPTPFASCPVEAFVTRGTALTSLNLQTGAFTTLGNGAVQPTESVNAIGFRSADGYLWGWYNNGTISRLIRIGSNGVADFPYPVRPTNMPLSVGGYSGDVDPVTGHYVVVDSYEENPKTLYWVDVETNVAVRSLQTSVFESSTDFAFDKNANYIYSVVGGSGPNAGEVFRVAWNGSSLGAKESLLNLPTNLGSGGFGAIFMDSSDTMYAYRSGSGTPAVGLVYRIFKTQSGGWAYDLMVNNALTSTNLDGARCPGAAPPVTTAGLVLRKTTKTIAGGPFGFSVSNATTVTASVTTSSADVAVQVDGDSTVTGTQAFTLRGLGANVVVTETSMPPGWQLESAHCKNAAGTAVGSTTGNAVTIPGAAVTAGQLFECDFTNARIAVDLSLTKSNAVQQVVPGTPFVYLLQVSNNGPGIAHGAVLRDPAVTGMSCTQLVCSSATGGAACPTAAQTTVTVLQSVSGLALPTLPSGGRLNFELTCTVQ